MKHDNMKITYVILGLVILGGIVLLGSVSNNTLGGVEIPLTANTTSTSVTATTTAWVQLDVARSGAYRRIISNTGSNTIYVLENSTTTGFAVGSGFPVFASTRFDEYGDSLWKGVIYVSTLSGTSTAGISNKY